MIRNSYGQLGRVRRMCGRRFDWFLNLLV